jgi:nitronate monooxygenase
LTGDVQKDLFFRATGVLPFGEKILPVKELMIWLMSGESPLKHSL